MTERRLRVTEQRLRDIERWAQGWQHYFTFTKTQPGDPYLALDMSTEHTLALVEVIRQLRRYE